MECVTLGWPSDSVSIRLDYRLFSYAGKFIPTNTGKAVIRGPDAEHSIPDGIPAVPPSVDPSVFDHSVIAAVAFNADRTDPSRLWIRYVTVRSDRRGQALGPRLIMHVLSEAATHGYQIAVIAVNNPFAYHALHKAGFAFTGDETGLAEVVLERPIDKPAKQTTRLYQRGLDRYRARGNLSQQERAFLKSKRNQGLPALVEQ